MEKRQEVLAPFSSDECPNSGEDSDEDLITDYVGSSHSDCDRVPIINGDLSDLHLRESIITDNHYTKDNIIIKTGNRMSSDNTDGQQQQQQHHHHQHPLLTIGNNTQVQSNNPLVPIISVTPHSPNVAKNYLVLEDNLLHLHEINDSIQRMRDSTLGYHNRIANNEFHQRLTSSCPSLSPMITTDNRRRINDHDIGSDPDLLNCSNNSSPTHFPIVGYHHHIHHRAQLAQGIDRRRSWTDLEDNRRGRRRCSAQNHLQAQNMRQRSTSLSSLDSGEMELDSDGKSRVCAVGVGNRACRSQTSTHSLNEADLVQSEYKKIAIKRGSQRLGENITLMPGLTGSRLPLQKSISTPSIVTPQVHTNLNESGTRTTPSLTARHERNEKGSGSETETEDLHTLHCHEFRQDRDGTSNAQILDELLTEVAVYDEQSEKTRRKRGSIFFRKKKDKSGKKTNQQHGWVLVPSGSQIYLCEICMKHSSNKGLLHCESCGTTVHQNHGCKDQFTLECIKLKNQNHKGAAKSLSNASSISSISGAKRGSTSSLPPAISGRDNNSKKAVTSYSPWRRVATKLGVNQTINEEKDGDGSSQHRDNSSGLEDFDFGEEAQQLTIDDLESLDPDLGLGKEEPDSWSAAIGRNIALQLVDHCEREVKRQEHIYEFVLTEKHHCLVLLAMDRIFAENLRRHFRLNQSDVERMFPRLRDLIDIHLRFLQKLRKRQSANPVVLSIADILLDQFSSENAQRMKSAYGEFCSRHRDAVEAYKYFLRSDPRFARFVRQCQTHPLLKKKGIPECILFVTQRLTKYPLLIEPLIKTGINPNEGDNLRKALSLVKEILAEVDTRVADKEREDRKLEIYNRIDAKSFAMYRTEKFKKSAILASNRVLKFEGTAYMMQGRGKMTPIVVVVLSDILFFLVERDQKYAFYLPENKVISLQKLFVREKAGQESRGIYLISNHSDGPEMFELKVQKPKDKLIWIQAIRSAVETCPIETENDTEVVFDNNSTHELRDTRSSLSLLSIEEKQKIAKVKETRILRIVDELRKKDAEQATLLEEKIHLQMRLLQAANLSSGNESDSERTENGEKEVSGYSQLMNNEGTEPTQLWQEVILVVQEATELASSLSFGAGGATLSRSLSSAGERHSDTYVPAALSVPKRAETFAGFDHSKDKYPLRDSNIPQQTTIPLPKEVSELLKESLGEKESAQEMEVNKEQQRAAIRLSHHIYRLLCIISNQMTTIDSLQAQLATCKEGSIGSGKFSNSRPNPNRQLEELRNLQDQLSREKAEFRAKSQQERDQMDEERVELARQRDQLNMEKKDIEQQREQLYRRLEVLERQGVALVTGSTTGSTTIHLSSHVVQGTDSTAVHSRKSQPPTQPDTKRRPINLISTNNQQKRQNNVPVKQQLPLKLASGSNNSSNLSRRTVNRSGSTASNDSPDRHSRTGSSPAIVNSSSTYSSPELGNPNCGTSQTYSSNRSLTVNRSPTETYQSPQQQQPSPQSQPQQPPMEEEVIYF